MQETEYWLCASGEVEHVYAAEAGSDLYAKAMYAVWALQILCPTGAKHVFLLLHDTGDGFDNLESLHPKPLLSTLMGRLASREGMGLEKHFEPIYAGVQRAFTEKMIRLVNPIVLLEHGMQSDNVNISSLLCVMALDMLFMAGQTNPFLKRLGGFLGLSTFVFPPDSWECRPSPVVAEVIGDLYEFRNIIAHGQQIPSKPYLEPYNLTCTTGPRVIDRAYRYDQLMQESARFMLTATLRKIFIDGLVDDVKDDRTWGSKLASSGESVGNWGLSAGGFVRKRWSLRQVGIE